MVQALWLQARRLFRMATFIAAADVAAIIAALIADVILIVVALTEKRDQQQRNCKPGEIAATAVILAAVFLLIPGWLAGQLYLSITIARSVISRAEWGEFEAPEFQANETRYSVVAFLLLLAALSQLFISPIAAGTAGVCRKGINTRQNVAWDEGNAAHKAVTTVGAWASFLGASGALAAGFIYLTSNAKHPVRAYSIRLPVPLFCMCQYSITGNGLGSSFLDSMEFAPDQKTAS